jgi:hypothetical protein
MIEKIQIRLKVHYIELMETNKTDNTYQTSFNIELLKKDFKTKVCYIIVH